VRRSAKEVWLVLWAAPTRTVSVLAPESLAAQVNTSTIHLAPLKREAALESIWHWMVVQANT